MCSPSTGLSALVGSIVIPAAVSAELHANGIFLTADRVELNEPRNRAAVDRLRAEPDAGESETIVLAQQLKASLFTGLLGILAEARKRGLISSCSSLLDSTIGRARYWIGEHLRSDYLNQ